MTIDWKKISIESVAIVVSILLAFSIEAWWDERQERAAEKTALQALQKELQFNLDRFNSAHDFHLETANSNKALLGKLVDAPQNSIVEVPDSQLANLISYITREAATGTLNTLLASGNIDLIQNQELQQALAGWSTVLDDTSENEVGIRDFIIEQLIPGLTTHVDLSILFVSRTSAGVLTDRAFTLTGRSSGLSVNRETLTLIGTRHLLSQGLIRSSSVRIGQTEEILELIKSQLQS